jgi:neutral ceramidase
MRTPSAPRLPLLCLACTPKSPPQPQPSGQASPNVTSPPASAWNSRAVTAKATTKAFHDACKVRVALFDDGKKRAAVIGLDSLVVPRQVVLDARAQIEKATGITGDCGADLRLTFA